VVKEVPNHTTKKVSLVLYNLFNTLCIGYAACTFQESPKARKKNTYTRVNQPVPAKFHPLSHGKFTKEESNVTLSIKFEHGVSCMEEE
jgi:hypothetical protein